MANPLPASVRWVPQLLASGGQYQPGTVSSTCLGGQATAYELCYMCSTIAAAGRPDVVVRVSTAPGCPTFANTTASCPLSLR